MAWNDRFKIASVKKRQEKERLHRQFESEQQLERSIPQRVIDEAENVPFSDIQSFLASQGYSLKCEGRSYQVFLGGQKVFGLDQNRDGKWFAVGRKGETICGNLGGNMISLVKEVAGCSFPEAIEILTGYSADKPFLSISDTPGAVKEALPVNQNRKESKVLDLPQQLEHHRQSGRTYLRHRGIDSDDILDNAEKAGFLRYSQGYLLFCDAEHHNVTRRAIFDAKYVKKGNLADSSKEYPQILFGDVEKLYIVEGGVDALATQCLLIRLGHLPPTVLCTAGANVQRLFDSRYLQPQTQQIIIAANKIVLVYENEDDEEIQLKTDQGHNAQFKLIKEIVRPDTEIICWRPPRPYKDIADLNLAHAQAPDPAQATAAGYSSR